MLDPPASPFMPVPAPPAPPGEVVLAWLVFVGLLALALVAIPLAAALLRRALPASLRRPIPLDPIAFGHSPHAQRSPRHPIRMHRTLLAAALLTLPALIVLLAVGVVRRDGLAAIEGALSLCLPILLVTIHARRRSTHA
ncbi:MAG: hypothetical protein R3F35_12060 [Myxococcota bacterium]